MSRWYCPDHGEQCGPMYLGPKNDHPIGEFNDVAIARWVIHPRCAQIVCGWGNHGEYKERGRDVLGLIRTAGGKPYALNLTMLGQPVHPLYQPYSLKPRPISAIEVDSRALARKGRHVHQR